MTSHYSHRHPLSRVRVLDFQRCRASWMGACGRYSCSSVRLSHFGSICVREFPNSLLPHVLPRSPPLPIVLPSLSSLPPPAATASSPSSSLSSSSILLFRNALYCLEPLSPPRSFLYGSSSVAIRAMVSSNIARLFLYRSPRVPGMMGRPFEFRDLSLFVCAPTADNDQIRQ